MYGNATVAISQVASCNSLKKWKGSAVRKLDKELVKSWEKAEKLYFRQMTDKGRSYLSQRGIGEEMIDHFQLGEVVDPLPGHETMVGRLVIPNRKRLATVGLKFRCLSDHSCRLEKCPKYLSDGEQWLFNTVAVDVPSSFLCVCEGELDTIILTAIGLPAVGIPGAESWQGHAWWPDILKTHQRIWIFADNDTKDEKRNPGMELAKRIVKDLPRAQIIYLPENQDVTDVYLSDGPERLLDLIGLNNRTLSLVA